MVRHWDCEQLYHFAKDTMSLEQVLTDSPQNCNVPDKTTMLVTYNNHYNAHIVLCKESYYYFTHYVRPGPENIKIFASQGNQSLKAYRIIHIAFKEEKCLKL